MGFGAGAFNRRVPFQVYSGSYNDEGVYVKAWNTYKTLWAKVYPISAKEYFSGGTTQSLDTVRIVVRYRTDLKNTMRFVYQGKSYEVEEIINDNDARVTLTIIGKVVT